MVISFSLMNLLTKSLNKPLLAAVAAAGLGLCVHSPAQAGHCGCKSHQHHPMAVGRPGCSCDCRGKTNCLEKAFDSFSAGLDRLFGLDKSGCDEMLCDDACDAAMIEDLMTPMPPMMPGGESLPSQPMRSPRVRQPHQRPMESMEMVPAAPDRSVNGAAPPAIEELPAKDADDSPIKQVPPPVRLDPRATQPEESDQQEDEEGSLFDTLSDPFGDDEARTESMRSIRPSSYQRNSYRRRSYPRSGPQRIVGQQVELKPVPRRPLPVSVSPQRPANRTR